MTELPDVFMLWGHELSRCSPYDSWNSNEWPWIRVECRIWPGGVGDWLISVMWVDSTKVADHGHTFAEAKRNLANLLSERSREVGHVG